MKEGTNLIGGFYFHLIDMLDHVTEHDGGKTPFSHNLIDMRKDVGY